MDLTILPSTFFDILWNHQKNFPCEIKFTYFDDFFEQTELNLPKEIYAYHWHNRWTHKTPSFFK